MNLLRVRFAGQLGMLNLTNSVRMSVWWSIANAVKFLPSWADLERGISIQSGASGCEKANGTIRKQFTKPVPQPDTLVCIILYTFSCNYGLSSYFWYHGSQISGTSSATLCIEFMSKPWLQIVMAGNSSSVIGSEVVLIVVTTGCVINLPYHLHFIMYFVH